ncbi:PE-PPE domain-containing protein [Mycobacterium sp.]|uniref:PE-PPE domain-containing protein n=1 Tax=Mycobacterium sp. TaxID=1785 RepID=UPI0025CDC23F|nr:PE-PPE domain-containing protein [Mycobacterium sp.]MBW0012628.1 PE-PPE domain-containing protein [Mycobacterium sp.]
MTTTIIFVPGTRPGRPLTTDQQQKIMTSVFGGAFAGPDYTCRRLNYPAKFWPLTGPSSPTLGASIAQGVAMLDEAIKSTTGDMMVVGFSQGCLVIEQELRNLEDDPEAPAASDLRAVLVSDPIRPGGMLRTFFAPGQTIPVLRYTMIEPANTQYDVTVIEREYDGAADWPENRRAAIAKINAVAGFLTMHCGLPPSAKRPHSHLPDRSTPVLDVTTCPRGGTVTTYLYPTWPLPLTRFLPARVRDFASEAMRERVDAGYNRAARKFTP